MEYKPVIGLEVHVQLNTKSKVFCACSANHFGKKPNSQTCPICLGLPGAIPSPPNDDAIKKAVLVAKGLGCRLAEECYFERKCYFYPDLPKGFQISQHRTAIGEGGSFAGVRIRRAHLEEDAAKLVHEDDYTLVDFNRAGVPLVEIVTEPEVPSPYGAKDFLKELRTLFRHLKISDADMEKGSMRLEANISLYKGKRQLPDYRVELKNINSFNFLVKALEVEIRRQELLLRAGEKVVQETRGYNEKTGETYSQRRKEEAADYRYFPEPDLPPLTAKVLACKEEATRPEELRRQLEKKYDLPQHYVRVLVDDPDLLRFSTDVVAGTASVVSPREAVSAIINQRFGDPKKLGVRGLIKAIKTEKERTLLSGSQVERHVDKVLRDNPQAVKDYKAGKDAALQFLLGQLMRETRGEIDPEEAREILKERLVSAD